LELLKKIFWGQKKQNFPGLGPEGAAFIAVIFLKAGLLGSGLLGLGALGRRRKQT